MFNACVRCGSYHADKRIDPEGPFAICPECGYRHRFVRLPLFVVTGASGSGKTHASVKVADAGAGVIAMESDILWMKEFDRPDEDYRSYREMWLRLCKNISQGGKPVALFGSVVPSQLETCVERRYFSKIHYLALVCSDEVLARRLRSRPAWRGTGADAFIDGQIRFNRWFTDNADKTSPAMSLLDTTDDSEEATVEKIKRWIAGA